jgi:hypothetical protein
MPWQNTATAEQEVRLQSDAWNDSTVARLSAVMKSKLLQLFAVLDLRDCNTGIFNLIAVYAPYHGFGVTTSLFTILTILVDTIGLCM